MSSLRFHTLVCGLFAIATLLLSASGARAATLPVPSQYATIQAGIDAAATGDTVLVSDGTYTGAGNIDLNFGGKAITVASVNGAASTIIDCQGSSSNLHRGFYFHSGETSAATVNGFTIENGDPPTDALGYTFGSAIDIISGSSPTIIDCICTDGLADGVGMNGNCNPTFTDCTISNSQYGGMDISNSSSPILTSCAITGSHGRGIEIDYTSNPTLTNCTITGSQSSAMFLYNSNPIITNCTITGNQSDGATLYGGSNPTFTNCILWNNAGSELNLYAGAPVLSYCDVQEDYTGIGNINADPLFVNAPTDLRLQATSPCVGAGTATGAPTTDFDGNTRPTPPSIGAYEAAPPALRFDFDGDGHNDLLWYNTLTGDTLTWSMTDQNINAQNIPFATVANTHWIPVAVADVDGDHKPDILLQNTQTGKLLFWLTATAPMGQEFAYGTPFATVADTNWRVVSMADFDGDGSPDILWQNRATGQVLVWYMSGAAVQTYGTPFATVANTNWQIVGTADFDGDGHPDLLWQNTLSGNVLVWNMGGTDGTTVLTYGHALANVSNPNWRIVGTGDMNGDGHPDLLWQNRQSGNVLRWLMGGSDGQQILSQGSAFTNIAGPNWQIVGIH